MFEYHANTIWLVHVATTIFLVGLIWVVQVVHYPLFALVGTERFHDYSRSHTRLITWLVAPTMLTEVGSGLILFFVRPSGLSLSVLVFSFGLIIVIWLSTWLVQVPCHERLGCVFEPATHRRLVRTNWIRTVAWTIRGGLLLAQTWNLIRLPAVS